LSAEEMKKMNEILSLLGRKLKNSLSLRKKRARRGKFDVKKTIRKSMPSGGIPFRLVLRRKKKEKPEVVILMDISDSVRNVARFMLQFVYSLHDLFSRIKSYAFVAEVGEVTELMNKKEIEEAISDIFNGKVVNVFSHSNYGSALRQFNEKHIGSVNRKTTVIVLGDGRTNYGDPCDWVMRSIKAKAKNVIWLNPEPPAYWGTGDSEMTSYSRHCTKVSECSNLKQLTEFVAGLVV